METTEIERHEKKMQKVRLAIEAIGKLTYAKELMIKADMGFPTGELDKAIAAAELTLRNFQKKGRVA
jgi:hypothetical protein